MSLSELAVVALVVMATIVATFLIAFAAWLAMIRRINEVSSRHRVGAPVRWVASPTRPAMLHRRLRAAVSVMRKSVPPPRRHRPTTSAHDLADEVESLAAALDRELLSIARMPVGPRSTALALTATRVDRVESLSRRVCRIAAQGDPSRVTDEQWDSRASEIDDRVRVLREAQMEVETLERQLGLG
jgi:hypothetical protein